ncbi:MAG: DUF3857 domain-containing protein [Bacteroidota bacterium]
MRILPTCLIILLLSITLVAQETNDRFAWVEDPGFSSINEDYEDENVIGVFINEKYDYLYDEDGNLYNLHYLHRRLRLNSDEAVSANNRLSVSLVNVVEVVEVMARVIKPTGEIIEFDRNNIREIVEEGSGNNYKIFAFDGIETGDDIEYLIVRRMNGGNFGRVFFQFEYPVQQASFELISPENLLYAAKGYNGFPDAVPVEREDARNHLVSTMEAIPAMQELPYTYFHPRRARIEFKLEYNLLRGKSKVLTYNDAAQRIYEIMYDDVNERSLSRWLKELGTLQGTSHQKAVFIENYLKENIYLQDYNTPEFSDLEFIRTQKVSGAQGIVRLYVNLFKAMEIPHEIVVTASRSSIPLDPDFESWNYLDEYLIYLPESDTYIEPGAVFHRSGMVDGDLTATHGLFIQLLTLGSFESAVGKIKYIEPAPYRANYDNMLIQVSVDAENGTAQIRNTRAMKGLSGGYLKYIYAIVDEETKFEILKDILESKAPNADYETLETLESTDVDFMHDGEFVVYTHFNSLSLVEAAGNRLLVKIGETIGPQVELYYNDERTIGGISDFNRWYYRRIIFDIPEGYRVVNPQAANFDVTLEDNQQTNFAFVSSHRFENNQLIIDIDEYYRVIKVEPKQFEGFRKVINAAADFNKVVLVLEPVEGQGK